MDREKALNRLKEINNNLTLLMKEKRALQTYIQEENDRLKNDSIRNKIIELRNDKQFIEEHGRKRTYKEVAIKLNYTERQVYRYIKKEL